MLWISGRESATYLAERDGIRARVWRALDRTWSARVILPRQEFWHHNFPTADAAKAWCEEQVAKLMHGA